MSYEELKGVAEDLYRFLDASVRNIKRDSEYKAHSLLSGEGPEEDRFADFASIGDFMKREGYCDSVIVTTERGREEVYVSTRKHQKMRALCESITQYFKEKEGFKVGGEDYFHLLYNARILASKAGKEQKIADDILQNPLIISLYPQKLREIEEADLTERQKLNVVE